MMLDHMILPVNDVAESSKFYEDVLGLQEEGKDGPFTVMRVSDDSILLLSGHGTGGGLHLAFGMNREQFEEVFERIRSQGVDYGDSFHAVGNNQGPGVERGARGQSNSLYFFDPNRHLFEILHYNNR
jgi:catechol 2,3-dioxygenase-like lactoylglutathione lyase family enzyme